MFLKPGRFSEITKTDARSLSVEDLRTLATWSGWMREDLWLQDDGHELDLQGILNTYHASSEWDGVETWLSSENRDEDCAVEVWRSIVRHSKARASSSDFDVIKEEYVWQPGIAESVPMAVLNG